MARPTSLTPALRDSIAADVGSGATYDIAAECNGISPSALYDWMARGRRGEEPFAEFAQAIARARAKFKHDAVQAVRRGVMPSGEFDWKAQAWLLERLDPEQFGPQQAVNVKVTKELQGMLDTLEKVLAPNDYDKALRALTGEDGGGEAEGSD